MLGTYRPTTRPVWTPTTSRRRSPHSTNPKANARDPPSTRNEAVMDAVRFHFDPICPWCYQTSRWAKRVEQLGEIELDWGLFSLEVVNLKDGERSPRAASPVGPRTSDGDPHPT